MAAAKRVSFASYNLFNLNLPNLPMYRNTEGWDTETYNRKVLVRFDSGELCLQSIKIPSG